MQRDLLCVNALSTTVSAVVADTPIILIRESTFVEWFGKDGARRVGEFIGDLPDHSLKFFNPSHTTSNQRNRDQRGRRPNTRNHGNVVSNSQPNFANSTAPSTPPAPPITVIPSNTNHQVTGVNLILTPEEHYCPEEPEDMFVNALFAKNYKNGFTSLAEIECEPSRISGEKERIKEAVEAVAIMFADR